MKKELKIAVVYTGITSSLMEMVESEARRALTGANVTFLTFSNPSIIEAANKHGHVTHEAARDLVRMYMAGMAAGADIIYNICSSVGDVADTVRPAFGAMGMPFVRIDEDMAREAICTGRRIGVLATLQSTLQPTRRLLLRYAKEAGKEIELVDALANGAFGLSDAELAKVLVEKAASIAPRVDCMLLAQGSMAACEQAIADATGKPAFSSPRFGALALKKAAETL
jgi:L-lactate permease